jgi:hypothetical protein
MVLGSLAVLLACVAVNGVRCEAPADDGTPVTPVRPVAAAGEPFPWKTAASQAIAFTAVMHAYRFATEEGSRDAIHGSFFHNYFASVRELRGWDDADGFGTSYIGHPMEGAAFAFIRTQNDPRYRRLVFNQGRDYWMGRLHALEFAAIFSTQWTLGPLSEASLGNVQLHSSPGFVDLVGTPTLGLGWSIGEDAIDRYLIARLERHTANRGLLILARSLGNPTRAFANLMGGRRPWERDTRPGLYGAAFIARSRSIRRHEGSADRVMPPKARPNTVYPAAAPVELMATTHYETFTGGGSCIGGGGSGAVRIAPAWMLVAEVSGCLVINQPTNQSGDSLLYAAGLRWTPRAAHHLSPYLQFLAGGRKLTHETLDPQKRDELLNAWEAGQLPHYPKRSDYSTEQSANGLALLGGGGLDLNVKPSLAVRLFNLEYSRSYLPAVDRIDAAQGLRFTSGLVLRIGTW